MEKQQIKSIRMANKQKKQSFKKINKIDAAQQD